MEKYLFENATPGVKNRISLYTSRKITRIIVSSSIKTKTSIGKNFVFYTNGFSNLIWDLNTQERDDVDEAGFTNICVENMESVIAADIHVVIEREENRHGFFNKENY